MMRQRNKRLWPSGRWPRNSRKKSVPVGSLLVSPLPCQQCMWVASLSLFDLYISMHLFLHVKFTISQSLPLILSGHTVADPSQDCQPWEDPVNRSGGRLVRPDQQSELLISTCPFSILETRERPRKCTRFHMGATSSY